MCWQGNHVAQQCFTSGYPLWTLEALCGRWCPVFCGCLVALRAPVWGMGHGSHYMGPV